MDSSRETVVEYDKNGKVRNLHKLHDLVDEDKEPKVLEDLPRTKNELKAKIKREVADRKEK